MTLYRITPDDIESFTIIANPKKTFASSSASGITGSANLFARKSDIEKETQPLSLFEQTQFDDQNLNILLDTVRQNAKTETNISSSVNSYLQGVNQQGISGRKQKQLNIFRFEPSFTFTKDTLKKNTIREGLYPYYRSLYPDMHWAHTNYHCLNFFTSSEVPSNSAIIYPNSSSAESTTYASGGYTTPGPFTFEFYINPKYTTSKAHGTFNAGTILHLSSSYAISLVTGSSKDAQGYADRYRIQLQLSHSADISPSSATPGSYPNDLIFLTPDNSLKRNHWHHISIRWGTNNVNEGTGSFFIDGVESSNFVIPSASVAPVPYGVPQGNPDALIVGNFYEGTNQGTSAQSIFFNSEPATRDGLINMAPSFNQDGPINFSFNHPLNAELHDLRIYGNFRLASNIEKSTKNGPDNLDEMLFYLPPFFTKESPFRQVLDEHGGVLQTPFFGIDSTTDDQFNAAMSFGVGGHYINLENYLREMVSGNYPRQLELTASQIVVTANPKSANEFLYDNEDVRKRNVTILPCDNGLFIPNFDLLKSGTFSNLPTTSSILSKFVNDLGHLDLSLISLNNIVAPSSLRPGLVFQSGSIFDGIAGASPEDPGVDPGEVLTIYQRTRDSSSNEVSFFDISNIFFGNRINPESFKITDSAISGTGEAVSITLRDNGYGNMYRADALTDHAKWNSIGNIFYNEGIVVIKSPNIPFFGKEQYSMEFEGEQSIHVLKISAEAMAGLVNSSSNPDYKLVSASLSANDTDTNFVYITNIDWLDDNLNVIMKTNISQPIKKRSGDKLLIRAKMDF